MNLAPRSSHHATAERPTSVRQHSGLDGHRVAFKDERWWVIEIDDDHPFEGVTREEAEFAIYDIVEGFLLATACRTHAGRYLCSYCCGQHSFDHEVDDLRQAGRIIDREALRVSREMNE